MIQVEPCIIRGCMADPAAVTRVYVRGVGVAWIISEVLPFGATVLVPSGLNWGLCAAIAWILGLRHSIVLVHRLRRGALRPMLRHVPSTYFRSCAASLFASPTLLGIG
jgi:hypothetical protein